MNLVMSELVRMVRLYFVGVCFEILGTAFSLADHRKLLGVQSG